LTAGNDEGARDAYRRAIEIEPRNVLARMQLARLYETVFGDFHSAARMCGEVRALAPTTPGVTECVERNQRLAAAKDAGR
jgi:Flp pilus assembly protein TadD